DAAGDVEQEWLVERVRLGDVQAREIGPGQREGELHVVRGEIRGVIQPDIDRGGRHAATRGRTRRIDLEREVGRGRRHPREQDNEAEYQAPKHDIISRVLLTLTIGLRDVEATMAP